MQTGVIVNQPIAALESRRKALYLKLEDLEDFRRGTVPVNYRKCGKSNCSCAGVDHPGHGPQYLWNASIGGKTQARSLPFGTGTGKGGERGAALHTFVQLCGGIVAVNDEICRLLPVPVVDDENELKQLKKTAQAFRRTKK